jgi:hypothetical protein
LLGGQLFGVRRAAAGTATEVAIQKDQRAAGAANEGEQADRSERHRERCGCAQVQCSVADRLGYLVATNLSRRRSRLPLLRGEAPTCGIGDGTRDRTDHSQVHGSAG